MCRRPLPVVVDSSNPIPEANTVADRQRGCCVSELQLTRMRLQLDGIRTRRHSVPSSCQRLDEGSGRQVFGLTGSRVDPEESLVGGEPKQALGILDQAGARVMNARSSSQAVIGVHFLRDRRLAPQR